MDHSAANRSLFEKYPKLYFLGTGEGKEYLVTIKISDGPAFAACITRTDAEKIAAKYDPKMCLKAVERTEAQFFSDSPMPCPRILLLQPKPG